MSVIEIVQPNTRQSVGREGLPNPVEGCHNRAGLPMTDCYSLYKPARFMASAASSARRMLRPRSLDRQRTLARDEDRGKGSH
jgi:hypothetical protein